MSSLTTSPRLSAPTSVPTAGARWLASFVGFPLGGPAAPLLTGAVLGTPHARSTSRKELA